MKKETRICDHCGVCDCVSDVRKYEIATSIRDDIASGQERVQYTSIDLCLTCVESIFNQLLQVEVVNSECAVKNGRVVNSYKKKIRKN